MRRRAKRQVTRGSLQGAKVRGTSQEVVAGLDQGQSRITAAVPGCAVEGTRVPARLGEERVTGAVRRTGQNVTQGAAPPQHDSDRD
jgi:hypothetical protein